MLRFLCSTGNQLFTTFFCLFLFTLRYLLKVNKGPDYMGRAGSFSELARLPSQLTCINKFNKFWICDYMVPSQPGKWAGPLIARRAGSLNGLIISI